MSVPDYALEDTLDFKFTTRAFATGIPTTLGGTPVVQVYEDNSVTQITAGITLSADFDSVAGLNNLRIAATAANGYEAGKSYAAVISTGTVGGVSVVGEVVQQFSIQRSPVNWGKVTAPTTAVDLSATDIQLCDTVTTNTDMLTAAAVNAEVDTALSDIKLDHLLAVADADDVADDSVIAKMVHNGIVTADWSLYDPTASSLVELSTLINANATKIGSPAVSLAADIGTAGAGLTDLGGMSTAMKAEVNTEADTALTDIHLDHLMAAAAADVVVDGSVIAHIVSATEDWSTFVPSTDSLQAVRDRGDTAWTTGAGGSPPDLLQSTTIATLASQTSFTLTAGSADDDAYNGAMVVVTDASTSTQKAVGLVLDYTGATKTVTLDADPGVFTMATTDNIDIIGKLASSGASAAAIADAVWDEAAAGHTDAGKAGQQLWTDIDAVLVDTDSLVTTVGAAGAGLTAINLPNQTMDITGNLSGSVGSVNGGVTLADGVEHGGTTATLRLGAAGATPAFYVTNSGGDAARFEVTASAGNGLHVMANGSSAGFFAEGGSSGFGMKARGYGGVAGLSISGGPTGAGLEVEGGSTSGDAVSLTATSGVGINAPDGITGDITGNLSGSVGSVTGHTAQTGDTYALANGAAGFVAIDTVVDAVKVKTDQMVFTKANELDANTQSINGAAVVGDGNATPWDGA